MRRKNEGAVGKGSAPRTTEVAAAGLGGRRLSYRGVTALTSLSEATIRRLVRRGKLAGPVPIPGTSRVAFREEDVREFLLGSSAEGTAEAHAQGEAR